MFHNSRSGQKCPDYRKTRPIGMAFLPCPDMDFRHAIPFLDYYSCNLTFVKLILPFDDSPRGGHFTYRLNSFAFFANLAFINKDIVNPVWSTLRASSDDGIA